MLKSQKGFTVIEFAIVITVVGILAVMVLPDMVSGLHTLRLNNAAQKLASDIRLLREIALSRHGTYGIDFNSVMNQYRLFEWDEANNTKILITDPHRGGTMIVDYDDRYEFTGVTIASGSEIRFDALGNPLDFSGNALDTPVQVSLENGDLTQDIQITNETGFVELI